MYDDVLDVWLYIYDHIGGTWIPVRRFEEEQKCHVSGTDTNAEVTA